MSASIAFVACVERGELEEKALLLCRSIRRFGGCYGGAPIFTFQPRIGTDISPQTVSRLADLGVHHITEPLNAHFAQYGIGNKIFAAARAEEIAGEDVLVFVDSDAIIVNEPAELALSDGIDAAVRPVDFHHTPHEPDDDDDPFWRTRFRRVGSSGPGDPMDAYWLRMYELLGVSNEPFVETTCSGQRIRAYFNSGLIAVRRRARLFSRWKDDFLRLAAARHLPRGGPMHYMDQLSLAATLTRVWDHVAILDGRYNYPLPGRAFLVEPFRSMPLEQLVHIHYNSAFGKTEALATIEPPIDGGAVARWLAPQLPLGLARRRSFAETI